jgi:hypothetical protein
LRGAICPPKKGIIANRQIRKKKGFLASGAVEKEVRRGADVIKETSFFRHEAKERCLLIILRAQV